MSWQEVLAVGTVVLGSLGGGGVIILGLSGYLGKLWADRLMETERSRHQQRLEELRAGLQATNEKALAEMRTDLEIYRDRHLKTHRDKVEVYRMGADIIATILANFDRASRPCPGRGRAGSRQFQSRPDSPLRLPRHDGSTGRHGRLRRAHRSLDPHHERFRALRLGSGSHS